MYVEITTAELRCSLERSKPFGANTTTHGIWVMLGQVLSRNEKLFAQIGARNKYERVTTERRGSHVAGKDQVQDFDDQTYRRFLNGTESDTGKAELDNTNKYFENKTITRWRKNCLYSQLSLRKK